MHGGLPSNLSITTKQFSNKHTIINLILREGTPSAASAEQKPDLIDLTSLLVTSSADDSIIVYDCNNGTKPRSMNSKKYGVDLIHLAHTKTSTNLSMNSADEEDNGNEDVDPTVCVSCHNPSSGAHFCKKCFEPCHAIPPCSISIDGEEGYGAKVVCCECWLRDEVAADENANIVKTAPSASDKPTTSASSPSIDYEPNIQLLNSEDEDDTTNPPTKRKRRAFTVHDKIEILDFAKKTSILAASKH
ncbi:hypothetical protein GPALN_006910 [Globodera pallida]|nr:hypothetical protein GPALN_006910 [Globodera pallida]